eukprot:EG_transcript_10898
MPLAAMHRWVSAGHLSSFWRPAAAYHNFCHFYRFVDPKLEAQRVRRMAGPSRTLLRVHCLVLLVLAVQELSNYFDSPDSPLFWSMFSICSISSLLLFVSFVGRSLFYSQPLHALYVCAVVGVVTYHLGAVFLHTSDDAMGYIYGEWPSRLSDAAVDARLREKVQELVGCIELRDALLYGCIHWISLVVAGFNRWTALAYAAVFLSNTIGIWQNPLIQWNKEIGGFFFLVATVGFGTLSIVMERVQRSDFLAHTLLARELQASQLADNVLNHMLKNALADVVANVEIFLVGELGPEVLEDAVVCLRRAIQSCRERMVYLKMVAGEYTPVLNAVNLQEFGQQLAAGRQVALQAPAGTVLMDGTLMQLILENALSNAVKHGHPDQPAVQLTVCREEPKDCAVTVTRRRPPSSISFVLKNAAHPLHPPLTDDAAAALLAGRGPPPRHGVVVPALSDGVGLQHCALAARLGGIALSLRQEGATVTFTATVE